MTTADSPHQLDPLSERESSLEALLFVSVDPVSVTTLARVLMLDDSEVAELLQRLSKRYVHERRGFVLRELAGGWQLASAPAHHHLIESYVQRWDTHKLSDASLEVLAVVAYHQPITREGVRAIRGVNSDGVISSLVDKGLIKAVGREKSIGAALLYGTTSTFLHTFGLSSLKDLPALDQFAPDEESKELIRERLGARLAPASQLLTVTDEGIDEDELMPACDQAQYPTVSTPKEDGDEAVNVEQDNKAEQQ